jgi:acetyl esterase/lipase
MKKIARLLGLISAFFMGLSLFPGMSGLFGTVKTMAGALSPVLGLFGGVAAALGALTRDPVAAVSGTTGAALATVHIRDSIQPHDGLREAFGPHWHANIPPEVRRGWLRDRWSPIPLSVKSRASVQHDVCFSPDTRLDADIWEPPPGVTRTRLGVLMVHGGAWHYGSKGDTPSALYNHLAGQGHTVVDIDYRLPPHGHFYEQVADVKRALAWMRRTLDVDKVVTYGFSAGAHLSLLAAYAPQHPRLTPVNLTDANLHVDGVVAFYPPADFDLFVREWVVHGDERFDPGPLDVAVERVLTPLLRRTGKVPPEGGYMYIGQVLPNFLGGTPHVVREVYDLASPVEHVTPAAPPTFIAHGTDDNLVSIRHSRNLYAKLQACGVPSLLTTYPRMGHGFDQFFVNVNPAGRSALYDAERFMARIAYN